MTRSVCSALVRGGSRLVDRVNGDNQKECQSVFGHRHGFAGDTSRAATSAYYKQPMLLSSGAKGCRFAYETTRIVLDHPSGLKAMKSCFRETEADKSEFPIDNGKEYP
jgi:hypothetical protein